MSQVFFGAVVPRVGGEGGVLYFARIGGFALGAVAMLAVVGNAPASRPRPFLFLPWKGGRALPLCLVKFSLGFAR